MSITMIWQARENFSKDNPREPGGLADEFIFDIVRLNQLSAGLEIQAYAPNSDNVVIRNHRYE